MSYQTDPAYRKAQATLVLANQPANQWVRDVYHPRWAGNQWAGGQWINLVNALGAIDAGRSDFVDAGGNLTASAVAELNQRADFLNSQMGGTPTTSTTAVPTHQQNIDFIRGLYSTYYHRAPDTAGLNFWVGELENGSQNRDSAPHVFATSTDQSPNAGQTLQAYLTAQGITPSLGYTFSADGQSIVPVAVAGTDPPGPATTSTIPFIGPFIDGVGDFAVGLPLVGPYIASWSQSFGISPGWIAIGGIAAGLYFAGAFDDGSGRRR